MTLRAMDHAARRDRVRAALDGAACDVLLVTDALGVRYLTGFTGSNGTLLVAASAEDDRLITDRRYRERVGGLDVARVETDVRLAEVLAGLGRSRVGVDPEHVTLAVAARLRAALAGGVLVDVPDLLMRFRTVKDAGEVARLEAACAITAETLSWAAERLLVPGRTEREVARAFEHELLARGADGIAFPTIVAGGPNGAAAHHEPGDRPLADGDLVTIDGGAELDGYRADMTRTLPVGDVRGLLREVHDLVVRANEAGRAAAVAGATVSQVDAAARDVIEAAGHGAAFVHPTGHGIGLAIHEAPLVTGGSAASLTVGTAFTVEPGVYLPGLGGVRIEDSLVVRPEGTAVMTVMERRLVGA
jgi:Xaa-Pro aminopeptidase